MIEFKIDWNQRGKQFNHFWEVSVGSCHASTTLREDYREQLKRCHEELGFQYVRFHGLFDDDMSVYFQDRDGKTHISFLNIDHIYDYLLSIGMKPFVELGFMPRTLASGEQECFHYRANVTMPKDIKLWNEFIEKFIVHLIDRYGMEEVSTWYFEVWNEPNLFFFFAGDQNDYFRLYENTARTIKNVDERLKVGGPATSGNTWIPDFINYCENNQVPVDFISTHHYPSDDPLWRSGCTIDEFFKNFTGDKNKYKRGVLKEMDQKAKMEAKEYPLLYTEWNATALFGDSVLDESYSAALCAKAIADADGLVEAYSFWCFSDIFEENGQFHEPFHGGYGLLNLHGIPKPVYRMFEMLHSLGTERLNVSGSHETVEILATKKEKELIAIAYNHNVPKEPIEKQEIVIEVKDAVFQNAEITYIDSSSANPKQKWIEMGSPEYLKKEQIEELMKGAIPHTEKVTVEDGKVTFMLDPHSVARIVLR